MSINCPDQPLTIDDVAIQHPSLRLAGTADTVARYQRGETIDLRLEASDDNPLRIYKLDRADPHGPIPSWGLAGMSDA